MRKVKLKNKKIIIVIVIIVLIIILFGCALLFSYMSLNLKINGKSSEKLEVNENYKDKGAKASIFGKKLDVYTFGKVNNKKLGTYKITYKSKYLFLSRKKSRKVKVVDTKAPEILLNGCSEVSLPLGDDYKEEGYTVKDNYDKKLNNKVKISSNIDKNKEGSYEVVYEVKDSSSNKSTVKRKVNVVKKEVVNNNSNSKVGTYIKGILIVNKKYHLPASYNPGVDPTAGDALAVLQNAAKGAGFNMPLLSGFRSYTRQTTLYNNYVKNYGEEKASTFSAKPGQSEHQSGLAFDVGELSDTYGDTPAGRWLADNAHKYGFIIRYLKGKESITGYQYEPWHIRYVGKSVAEDIYKRQVTLEEYLGV